MADPINDTDEERGQDAADRERSPQDVAVDEDAVGYARADLVDALSRIRGTLGPRGVGDRDRDTGLRLMPGDEWQLVGEIRALSDRVDRLATIAEAADQRATDLSLASSRYEERLGHLSEAMERSRAAHDRAASRILWLTVAVAALAVILGVSVLLRSVG
jgi:hypothetical protein